MLGFPSDTLHEAKCIVTHGTMGHLDPKQPPTKRKPFASILNHHFIQKVELILPEEIYQIIKIEFIAQRGNPKYSRVILPLGALLEGEFFNQYIKRGNVLMLSERRSGIDKVYSLRDGILTLYLDKESYERAGLVGKPDGVKGKRGTKPRWVVEINLRLPSMLHGKKGFDRIVYACKNALNTPVTWLFCDLGVTALDPDPMDTHFPKKATAQPTISTGVETSVPQLRPPSTLDAESGYVADFEDFAIETHEWLSLISLNSPRVNQEDSVDPFISRYTPPGGTITGSKLVKVTWQGFFSSSWAHGLLVEALQAVPSTSWFSLFVVGFGSDWLGDTKDCTILKPPNAPNEYILWEVSR